MRCPIDFSLSLLSVFGGSCCKHSSRMKVLICSLLATMLGFRVTAQVQTRLIDLRVDHFNPLDRRTFDARYFINQQDWFAGGPIFVYVPNRFEDYTQFLTAGAVYEISHDTNGMMVALEPRYYGESRPTPDLTVENLQWLTIHQQLADLAQLIGFVKSNYYGALNSRVILFGRGYGGAYALWARQKYPNLVDGVWASSAPINAALEYPQFLPNTYNVFNNIGGPECGQIITNAFQFIEDSVRSGEMSYVYERMQFCTPLDVEIEEHVALMFYVISLNIGNFFVSNARYTDVTEACDIMLTVDAEHPPENDLDAFARWYMDEFRQLGEDECISIKPYTVVYRNTSWDSIATSTGNRQGSWLSCTQFGQYPTSNNGENHPFGGRFMFELFHFLCSEIFDREL